MLKGCALLVRRSMFSSNGPITWLHLIYIQPALTMTSTKLVTPHLSWCICTLLYIIETNVQYSKHVELRQSYKEKMELQNDVLNRDNIIWPCWKFLKKGLNISELSLSTCFTPVGQWTWFLQLNMDIFVNMTIVGLHVFNNLQMRHRYPMILFTDVIKSS